MKLRNSLLLLFLGALLFNAVIQMAMKNYRVARLVELHRLEQDRDRLQRNIDEAEASIARLMNPVRLREVGEALGLEPLPLSSFTLLEEEP